MESKFEIKKDAHIKFEQARDPYVEVYIPVSFFCHADWEVEFPLEINDKSSVDFAKQFDFSALAESLSKISNEDDIRVGIKDKEAVSIVNEDKHYYLMSIVKVQVARDSLTYQKGRRYSGEESLYFMIKKGTVYSVENIISARAMRKEQEYAEYNPEKKIFRLNDDFEKNEYCNSFFNGPVFPDDFWPKGLTVNNPSYRNRLELIKQAKSTDAAQIPNIASSKALPTFFGQASNQESDKLDDFLKKCSKPTREYILSLKGKPKLSDIILGLALTSDEEAKFEKFKDNIVSKGYMDFPVSLNENYYDITTLIDHPLDPISNEEFSPLQISSCRKLINELEDAIRLLEAEREMNLHNDSSSASMLK